MPESKQSVIGNWGRGNIPGMREWEGYKLLGVRQDVLNGMSECQYFVYNSKCSVTLKTYQIIFLNVSPLSGNYCGGGLKGKRRVLNINPYLVQNVEEKDQERNSLKGRTRPELYRRRCKKKAAYIYIFSERELTYIFRKQEQ